MRKHRCGPQPGSVGRHGKETATRAGSETERLPSPPFLPYSSRLYSTLCPSQKVSSKISVPRRSNSQGSSQPSFKFCSYPDCLLPHNALLHILFPFKEGPHPPMSAPEPNAQQDSSLAPLLDMITPQCCHECKAHVRVTDFTEGAGIPVGKYN